jgi:hypothetical protein
LATVQGDCIRTTEDRLAQIKCFNDLGLAKLSAIDGKKTDWGGSFHVAPGPHELEFPVFYPGLLEFKVFYPGLWWPVAEYCILRMDAKPGHEYAVSQAGDEKEKAKTPHWFIIKDSVAGSTVSQERVQAKCH